MAHTGDGSAGAPPAPGAPAAPNAKALAFTELDDLFEELDQLLKNPDVGAQLAEQGVNVSLAMTLADGLRAYLRGDKEKALLELGTATDEIAARMARSAPPKERAPS
jgi:hypothetical protein